jgi:uncharacterized protein
MLTERIPLFPLGMVVVPGAIVPLHIFEPRYRVLVDELVARADDESDTVGFGVVAIRLGRETGVDGVHALHATGCFAQLRAVQPYDDGRYDIVCVGTRRFRLLDLDATGVYPRGQVQWLDEAVGDHVDHRDATARSLFTQYRQALGLEPLDDIEGPRALSYAITAEAILTPADRQALLEAQDDATRLRMGAALLSREIALWETLRTVPDVESARQPIALN